MMMNPPEQQQQQQRQSLPNVDDGPSLSLEEINEIRLVTLKQKQEQQSNIALLHVPNSVRSNPVAAATSAAAATSLSLTASSVVPIEYDVNTPFDDGMIFDDINISEDHPHCDNHQEQYMLEQRNKKRYELYVQSKTENFMRLDIHAQLFRKMEPYEAKKQEFLSALRTNTVIQSVHLSGYQLSDVLTETQIINDLCLQGICVMPKVYELFIFHGNCPALTEELLSQCITKMTSLKVLMIWNFCNLCHVPQLAASIRMHPNLSRVTFHIPSNLPKVYMDYGAFDLYAMAMAGMNNLKVLQVRCDIQRGGKQREAIISPEGIIILMNSTSIETLYLENCGLLDDHVDAIRDEVTLIKNTTLKSLYLSNNLFTDDVLYTFGQLLPNNNTLQSLDLSGCYISDGGGITLRNGIVNQNTSLLHLDIENIEDADDIMQEFEAYLQGNNNPNYQKPERVYDKQWMKDIRYQLRINRAYRHVGGKDHVHYSINHWLYAIEQVNDHMGCIYSIVRNNSHHFQLWLVSLSLQQSK